MAYAETRIRAVQKTHLFSKKWRKWTIKIRQARFRIRHCKRWRRSSELLLVLQSSSINHMRPCTAPTNGQENVSGAESDFAAEQKMHCIPTGIAWQICELLLSRGGALFVGIPEWLFHLRQTRNKRNISTVNYSSFCPSTGVLLWHQIKVKCCWCLKKALALCIAGFSRSDCICLSFPEDLYMRGGGNVKPLVTKREITVVVAPEQQWAEHTFFFTATLC